MVMNFSGFLLIINLLIINLIDLTYSHTYGVSNTAQLINAMSTARAGDTIELNNGTYRGAFRAEHSGSPNAMIVLSGNYRTIISNRDGYGLHLRKANYWHLKGLTVSNSRKGIVFDRSSNNIIEKMVIESIDEEGIHMRDHSSDNVINDCLIIMTGIRSVTHGEAIIIGSDYRHWFSGNPDKSDRNAIINNRIGPGFTHEAIVLNEGSCCGLVSRNEFNGHGMNGRNGYGCWVKIKGDRYRIEHNRGVSTVSEGFMVITSKALKTGGCENVFMHNSCHLQSDGYCIKVDDSERCDNIVYSDNDYTDGHALTNIPVTMKRRSLRLSFIKDEINFPLILAFTFLPCVMLLLIVVQYFYFRSKTVPLNSNY